MFLPVGRARLLVEALMGSLAMRSPESPGAAPGRPSGAAKKKEADKERAGVPARSSRRNGKALGHASLSSRAPRP